MVCILTIFWLANSSVELTHFILVEKFWKFAWIMQTHACWDLRCHYTVNCIRALATWLVLYNTAINEVQCISEGGLVNPVSKMGLACSHYLQLTCYWVRGGYSWHTKQLLLMHVHHLPRHSDGGIMCRWREGGNNEQRTFISQARLSYLALLTSSSMLGSPLITMMPLFILAGSSAQLEMPMKATLSSRATIYMKYAISSSIWSITNFLCGW